MNKPLPHLLSKSTFIRGKKCLKSLYLNKHCKNLRDELSDQQQFIFTQGTSVGELAQQLFPGGIDCSPESYYDFQEAVVKTHKAIKEGHSVIYEAAFQFNDVLVALDILVKKDDKWYAYEVKSSTKVSETYELDATVQYYVITNSGINLQDISIIHINNEYVKNGDLDIKQLFKTVSVKNEVKLNLPSIPEDIDIMKCTLKAKEVPSINIGKHCHSPYTCDFIGNCWKHIPENDSVFDLSNARGKQWDLYNQGILKIKDIPNNFDLNEKMLIQVNGVKINESIIDNESIQSFLNDIEYPVYHLDFETYGNVIPSLDNTRPYQQVVFQYSIHKQEKPNGPVQHFEYLAEPNNLNFREELIEKMIQNCGNIGQVLVYNQGFESSKIKDMIESFPKYKLELENILSRLKDLMIPFRNKWYYTPEMKGSYSIKKVLPAIIPSLSYDSLEIKDGGTASNTFATMMNGSFGGDTESTRKNLLKYCELDTYAMVEILNKLYKETVK